MSSNSLTVPTDGLAGINKILSKLKDTTGSSMFGVLGQIKPETAAVCVPSGFPSLDIGILENGGFPLGRLVEVFGKPSGGKTLIALRTIAQAQKMGLPCAYIDVEHGFQDEYGIRWMKRNGVDIDTLIYSNQDVAEDVMLEAYDMISAGVKVICIDSIGALVPESDSIKNLKSRGAKRADEFATTRVAALSRALSGRINQLASHATNNGVLLIAINQVRDKIGGMVYGDTKTTPGGFALQHATSIRLQVEKVKNISEGDIPIGVETKLACRKSKVCAPGRVTGNKTYPNIMFYFDGRQQDFIEALVPIAVTLGVISRPNMQTYSYTTLSGETITQRGIDNMVSTLKELGLESELNQAIISSTGKGSDVDSSYIDDVNDGDGIVSFEDD